LTRPPVYNRRPVKRDAFVIMLEFGKPIAV